MYKLENREYDFSRVSTAEALKVKSAMMILADSRASISNKEEAIKTLDDLALKHLIVKNEGEWLENLDEYAIESLFGNELAIIEISAQFQNRIKDFLQSLPSFQAANLNGKHNK